MRCVLGLVARAVVAQAWTHRGKQTFHQQLKLVRDSLPWADIG